MKYFIDEETRKASRSACYFEFMTGKYRGKCWLPDSISISADLFDESKLYDIISSVVPSFEYYGLTEISQDDWNQIIDKANLVGGKTQEAFDEANCWAKNVFASDCIITICGL